MKSIFRKFLAALVVTASMGTPTAQAGPILGDLTDGLPHIGAVTGMWSLFVNAGDILTITALRLSAFDPIMGLFDGPMGTGTLVAFADDTIAGNSGIFGGGFADPQISYLALTTGEYTVQVSEFSGLDEGLALPYEVTALGATGSRVPVPGTLLLLGIGLAGMGVSLRKRQHAL